MNDENTGFVMSDSWYNALKWIGLVVLPALATLYFAVGSLWGFLAIQQVVGTITAITTFLGLLLRRSAYNYTPPIASSPIGAIVVQQDPQGKPVDMRIEAYKDPFIVEDGKYALLDVRREPAKE